MGRYLPVLKAAQLGSLNKAAGELGYTQPSLWHIINTIESDLGVKLFHRNKRGVVLTETGGKLLKYMEEIESLEERLAQTAGSYARNRIRVGVFSDIVSQWVPDILAALYRSGPPKPHIELECQQHSADGIRGVTNHSLDCCFSTTPADPQLASYPLYDDPYYLAVSESHELAEREEVSLLELLHSGSVPLIPTNESTDPESVLSDFLKGSQEELPAPALIFSEPIDNRLTAALVERGLGVALLSGLCLRELSDTYRIKAVPVTEKLFRTIRFVCPKETDRPPMTDLFLSACLSTLAEWKKAAEAPGTGSTRAGTP